MLNNIHPCMLVHGSTKLARSQGVIKLPRKSNSKCKTPIHMCSSFLVGDKAHKNAIQFDHPACMHACRYNLTKMKN